MLRFWIFIVTMCYVKRMIVADPITNKEHTFEMVLRQNERLGQLEKIIEKLLKDNDEHKEVSNKLQQDIVVLTKTVVEQQNTIAKLEKNMELNKDKQTEHTWTDSPPLDTVSSRKSLQYFSEKDIEIKMRREKAKNNTDIEMQKHGNIRAARLLEGNVQPTSQPTTVAFYAYMSNNEDITRHHTLVFDHVETNLGNGYNQHTGAFIIPVTGIYLLTYTVFPFGTGSYASIELVVNSVARGAIFVDNSSSDSDLTDCTGNVVLVLNKGDSCIIRTHPTYHSTGKIDSNDLMRTSFSGVMIAQ